MHARAEIRRQLMCQQIESAGLSTELDSHVGHMQRRQDTLAQTQDQRRLGVAVMRAQFVKQRATLSRLGVETASNSFHLGV